jgi:hypothetical protein
MEWEGKAILYSLIEAGKSNPSYTERNRPVILLPRFEQCSVIFSIKLAEPGIRIYEAACRGLWQHTIVSTSMANM